MDPTYPLVPVLNFLSAFLVAFPFLMGVWKSWSAGLIIFAGWVFTISIVVGVDTIVWSDNVENVAPIWCDIASHLIIGSSTGVPACSLMITRRMYNIVRSRAIAPPSRYEMRKELLFDIFLGVLLPIIVMSLYYIVQGARFIIREESGCDGAYPISGASFLILDSWRVVFPTISALFHCPLIIKTFYYHSKDVNTFLNCNTTGVTRQYYFRLLAVGLGDILVTLPVGIATLILEFHHANPLVFYWGWKFTHNNWEPVLVPAVVWKRDTSERAAIGITEYAGVSSGLSFFLLFGLTGEARAAYRHAFAAIWRKTGQREALDSPRRARGGITPIMSGLSSFAVATRQGGDNESFGSSALSSVLDLRASNVFIEDRGKNADPGVDTVKFMPDVEKGGYLGKFDFEQGG